MHTTSERIINATEVAPVVTAPGWVLMDKDGQPVRKGEVIADFRGDMALVVGGRPPLNPASTGRVTVRHMTDEGLSGEYEYYPGVFSLTWKENDRV